MLFCPSCGKQTLAFVRDSMFQQKVYECGTCKKLHIMRAAESPVEEPKAPAADETQKQSDEQKKKLDEIVRKATDDAAQKFQESLKAATEEQEGEGQESLAEALEELAKEMEPMPVQMPNVPHIPTRKPEDVKESFLEHDGESVGDLEREMLKDFGSNIKGDNYTPDLKTKLKLNVFYQKVGNVMKDNQIDRFVDNQRRGRLTPRNLFKVHTGSDKVFSRKQERKNKEFAVIIVVDESGSMRHEDRIHAAAACTAALVRGLSRHHIRFGVIGFGDGVQVHKNLNERKTADELETTIANNYALTSGTNTFEALMAAEEMWKQASQREQVVIVFITDGLPEGHMYEYTKNRFGEDVGIATGFNRNTHIHELRSEIDRIPRSGAHLVPISIQCEKIHDWFPKARIVKDVGHFTDVMLEELGKIIIRE